MSNLIERLNFSQKDDSDSAVRLHAKNRDLGYYYDNLCLYCANNDIDISNISDDEFSNAALTMQDYAYSDAETDSYYFYID